MYYFFVSTSWCNIVQTNCLVLLSGNVQKAGYWAEHGRRGRDINDCVSCWSTFLMAMYSLLLLLYNSRPASHIKRSIRSSTLNFGWITVLVRELLLEILRLSSIGKWCVARGGGIICTSFELLQHCNSLVFLCFINILLLVITEHLLMCCRLDICFCYESGWAAWRNSLYCKLR